MDGVVCEVCGQGLLQEDEGTGFLVCPDCGTQSQAVLVEEVDAFETNATRQRVRRVKRKRQAVAQSDEHGAAWQNWLCYVEALQDLLQAQTKVVSAWFRSQLLEGVVRQVWRARLMHYQLLDEQHYKSRLKTSPKRKRPRRSESDAANSDAAGDVLASPTAAGPNSAGAAGPDSAGAAGPDSAGAAAAGPSAGAANPLAAAPTEEQAVAPPASRKEIFALMSRKMLPTSTTLECLLLAAWLLRLPLWASDLVAAAQAGELPFNRFASLSKAAQTAHERSLPPALLAPERHLLAPTLVRRAQNFAADVQMTVPDLNAGAFIRRYCVELGLPAALGLVAAQLQLPRVTDGQPLVPRLLPYKTSGERQQKAHVLLPLVLVADRVLAAVAARFHRGCMDDPRAHMSTRAAGASVAREQAHDDADRLAAQRQRCTDGVERPAARADWQALARDMMAWVEWHSGVGALKGMSVTRRLERVVQDPRGFEGLLAFVEREILDGQGPPEALAGAHAVFEASRKMLADAAPAVGLRRDGDGTDGTDGTYGAGPLASTDVDAPDVLGVLALARDALLEHFALEVGTSRQDARMMLADFERGVERVGGQLANLSI